MSHGFVRRFLFREKRTSSTAFLSDINYSTISLPVSRRGRTDDELQVPSLVFVSMMALFLSMTKEKDQNCRRENYQVPLSCLHSPLA